MSAGGRWALVSPVCFMHVRFVCGWRCAALHPLLLPSPRCCCCPPTPTAPAEYGEDGAPDLATVKPMVDGGTEGFKGHVRSAACSDAVRPA